MNNAIAVEALAALAQDSRLAVYRMLVQAGPDGLAAGDLADRVGVPANTLSFHLKTLKQAGFVRARKSAKWMYYSLNREALERFLGAVAEVFDLSLWPEKAHAKACDAAACEQGSGKAVVA